MAGGYGELVREGYAAWNSGDREWVLEHMSPDVEWVTPPDDPDPGIFKGHEGVERFWANWRDLFGLIRFDVQRIEDLGVHVLVHANRIGKGEQSGVEIQEQVFQLFTFGDDGRCIRVQEFYDRARADAIVDERAGRAD